jgi:citrate synthase
MTGAEAPYLEVHMASSTIAKPGLEGVTLTSTRLSRIEGDLGRLLYSGYSIDDLARQASFEEVCYLLWHGQLPNAGQLSAFGEQLSQERRLSEAEARLVASIPREGHATDALRTLVSGLAQLDPQAHELSDAAALRVGTRLLAKMPAMIAAWNRRRQGLEPAEPDPRLGFAAGALQLLLGRQPSPEATRAFDTYLILLAEHGLNASTFAARVAISAQADVYAAVVAAIATLRGLLHGGANQAAMETFLEIGAPENAAAYVEQLLARRGRLMGVGHRIYRTLDPRAPHLRAQVAALAGEAENQGALVADEVRRIVAEHPYFVERQLNPNVEFYSAPLLHLLGFPLDMFTAAFALSRTAGWIGHIREQIAENRIIRPRSDYSGPEPRQFVALDQRV